MNNPEISNVDSGETAWPLRELTLLEQARLSHIALLDIARRLGVEYSEGFITLRFMLAASIMSNLYDALIQELEDVELSRRTNTTPSTHPPLPHESDRPGLLGPDGEGTGGEQHHNGSNPTSEGR